MRLDELAQDVLCLQARARTNAQQSARDMPARQLFERIAERVRALEEMHHEQ